MGMGAWDEAGDDAAGVSKRKLEVRARGALLDANFNYAGGRCLDAVLKLSSSHCHVPLCRIAIAHVVSQLVWSRFCLSSWECYGTSRTEVRCHALQEKNVAGEQRFFLQSLWSASNLLAD